MTQTLKTPDWILRKAIPILHAKLNFIGNCHRDYDKEFMQAGAKIGDTLRIRLPEQYTVTDGAVFVPQPIAAAARPASLRQQQPSTYLKLDSEGNSTAGSSVAAATSVRRVFRASTSGAASLPHNNCTA